MYGLFKRTAPPIITKNDLNLGLDKNLEELKDFRISNNFKIIEMHNYNLNRNDIGMINSKKSFSGGYFFQLINNIRPNGNSNCNIIFSGFKKETVLEIMDSIFYLEDTNKWKINSKQYFLLFDIKHDAFEFTSKYY